MLHFKTCLHLQPGAKPVLFRPTIDPIKETVEKLIDPPEAEGIIEKVHSNK